MCEVVAKPRSFRHSLAVSFARGSFDTPPSAPFAAETLRVSDLPDPVVNALCWPSDSVRLAQVLVNLLNNAAKYTGTGGQIWFTPQLQHDSTVSRQPMVSIHVRDTGIGIPQELLPHVFEIFVQGQQTAAHMHHRSGHWPHLGAQPRRNARRNHRSPQQWRRRGK